MLESWGVGGSVVLWVSVPRKLDSATDNSRGFARRSLTNLCSSSFAGRWSCQMYSPTKVCIHVALGCSAPGPSPIFWKILADNSTARSECGPPNCCRHCARPFKTALLVSASMRSSRSLLKIPFTQRVDHSVNRTLRLSFCCWGFRSAPDGHVAAEGLVGCFTRSAPAVSEYGSG